MLANKARQVLQTLGERHWTTLGAAWLGAAAGLGLYLATLIVPPALVACSEICATQPLVLGLMQCLPVVGRVLLAGAGVWAVGFLGYDISTQVARTRSLLRTLVNESRPLPSRLRVEAARLGLTGHLVYIADPLPVAFCCGFWQPRIVLSTGLVRALRAAELRAVLLHEAHHLRRRDPLRLLATRALARLAFFLPVALDLRRRWEVASELAADEVVLRHEPVPSLAGALLKSAGATRLRPFLVATGAFDATSARIARLSGSQPRLPGISQRRLVVSLLVAAAILIGAVTAAYAAGPAAGAGCCSSGTICPTHT